MEAQMFELRRSIAECESFMSIRGLASPLPEAVLHSDGSYIIQPNPTSTKQYITRNISAAVFDYFGFPASYVDRTAEKFEEYVSSLAYVPPTRMDEFWKTTLSITQEVVRMLREGLPQVGPFYCHYQDREGNPFTLVEFMMPIQTGGMPFVLTRIQRI